MINNSVSVKHLLVSTIDYFNIHSADLIAKAYDWTYEGLRELELYTNLVPCVQANVPVVDYRFSLPCNMQVLTGITYKNQRLNPARSIRLYDKATLSNYPVSEHSYEQLANGYIQTTFTDDVVDIHYKSIPTEYDNELETDVPLVPDNEYVLKAMRFYLLMRLIMRGYVHPIFKIDDIMQLWEHNKAIAKTKARRMNPGERELVRIAWSSMVINPDAWNNALYRKIN